MRKLAEQFMGSIPLLLSLLVLAFGSGNAQAQTQGTGWKALGCSYGACDDFKVKGPWGDPSSAIPDAVASCEAVNPNWSCIPGGNNCFGNVLLGVYYAGGGTFIERICLATGAWGEVWYLQWSDTNTDSVCPLGEIIDPVNGYGCIDPGLVFVAETPDQSDDCPKSNETNPCNPANGNKSQREVDYASSASGGLTLARQYNSKGAYKTGQGMPAGWRHTYSRSMNEAPDRKPTIRFSAPAGQSSFYYSASDACSSGWDEIKTTAWSGDLATATASFSGGNECKISIGGSTVAYFPVRSGAAWSGFTPPTGTQTITRSNGSSVKFELVGSVWVNPLNPALKLIASGSDWIFTNANDTQETYNASGQLTTITYRNGQSETLDYNLTAAQGGDDDGNTLDRVTGPFGHTITFGYDVNGYLSTVTTPDGTVQYGMDANDNLVSVTHPDMSVRQYVYEDTTLPNHLTGIIDENNDRFATWAYDSAGRAISSEHAGGKKRVDLAYNTDGTTTLTMANGAVRTYTYTTEQGQRRIASLSGDVCSTCPGGRIKDRSYDSNGFVADMTDWNGNVTKTARNARGLIETLTEAFGATEQRVTATQWHASYRLPTKVTAPLNVTDYTYDTNGNVLTITVSGGGKARAWTLTYNANGQPLTVDGPRTDITDVTTLDYYACTTGNECGQLKSVTNALDQVTNYDNYDSAGRLTQVTEPNGLQALLGYDVRGRLATVTQTPTVGAPRVTTMTYDGVGQLATYTLPNGVVLTYAYDDAHYLTRITDTLGNYIAYGTDVMGDPLSEDTYDPAGNLSRAIQYTHDTNYRLDSVTSGGFTTDLAFDLVGNLTTETDPNNAVTQHLYDALNRLDTTTDALAGVTDFGYDNQDNLTQVTAPNGATTNYVYDALDDLASETSADRGLLTYTYDDSGNRLTVTDARGVTATYDYDALNRLSSVSYPNASENVTYAYDDAVSNGIGRLRSITDQSGTITYGYDEFGNVASDQRLMSGITYTTTYQYDDANNISSVTYPSGRVVDYGRDTAGQITQATSTRNSVSKTVVSAASYDPFGPVTSLTYGNGVVFNYQYGLDNRMTSINSSGIAGKAYSYDAAGNIAGINDSVNASLDKGFSFDVLGRLAAENMAPNNPLAYWRLGEASGTNAADASGNALDASYVGTVALGESALVGSVDTAIGINVSGSGHVAGPTLTGTTVTGIEAWFNTTSVGVFRPILSLHNSNYDRTILAHNADGTAGIYKDKTGYLLISDGVVSTNQAHHIAVWYDSTTNKTYLMIDGVTQQNTYTGNLLAVSNPRVDIAAFRYYSSVYPRYFGKIDDVAIYDSAVTASTFANRIAPLELNPSASSSLGYDANGNRISVDDGSTLKTLGYQAQSNQLASIDSIALQHDPAGNRTADQGGSRTFSYNNANRLSDVFSNGNSIASYVHNALGQRTKKTANGATVLYLYDLFGNLIAEHSDTGALIRDYVWLENTPVAQIDQGEVFSYLHVDHLGTPRLATNDAQTIVWRWDSDAFGSTLADEDPDGDNNATTVNLRFPGQYYDAETGFHYNYYRTYDPSMGRYLESDPIGLGGGLNTYGYVGGNPLSNTDPFGLIRWEGEFEIAGLSAGVGASRVVFNLQSECVGDKKVLIKNWVFWGFTTDIGLPPGGGIRGSVRLEDGLSSLNPENLNHQNLEGDFSAISIGPTIGIGLPTGIDLGKATGLGSGKGLDIGVISVTTAGDLKIPRENVRYIDCECTQ